MNKRSQEVEQELLQIKKSLELEEDALFNVKQKLRKLEEVEVDIKQAKREMNDIFYHMQDVWQGEQAKNTFWQIDDDVRQYDQKTVTITTEIQNELHKEQKKHQQSILALETKQQDFKKEMRL
ncbi:hypothetical protein [Listeria seeligeri]|uniref:hypothetical protein n=1 Tax=Listeria seeligeri TaxID=1640 RepID=UPI0018896458|nr:hypothetical protein [Listeria seeligeri]MBF2543697.1 hypothetical protein [Listeria seeligeri]MBF2642375.1 hypothetical protein [Listeria seeligeri]